MYLLRKGYEDGTSYTALRMTGVSTETDLLADREREKSLYVTATFIVVIRNKKGVILKCYS